MTYNSVGHNVQGCDFAANWLILASSDPNFVMSEISVNQMRKLSSALGVEVFAALEESLNVKIARGFGGF